MRKIMTGALALALAASISTSSCIGSFALTNKLLAWNRNIDSKFVNELVFIAFWVLPVYEVSGLADLLVINSIEFWSGTSPVASGKSIIEGQDGKYLVECDGKGYTITSQNDGSVTRLSFNSEEREWSYVDKSGKEYPLITFVDDTHVKTTGIDGQTRIVDLAAETSLFALK